MERSTYGYFLLFLMWSEHRSTIKSLTDKGGTPVVLQLNMNNPEFVSASRLSASATNFSREVYEFRRASRILSLSRSLVRSISANIV